MSEHHKETFISKYIFSLDHKMIAKQFLITGMLMGILGMVMSLLFRIQIGNPGESKFDGLHLKGKFASRHFSYRAIQAILPLIKFPNCEK